MGRAVRDLTEEAKKRAVLLLICVFGLAYLMSLTSSSVWINMPVAASIILFLRYITFDLDVRRRAAAREKIPSSHDDTKRKVIGFGKVCIEDSSWRSKVNSPAVEAAIDHFNKHIVSEWVTDLWYSRITPDKDGPKELVQIMNDIMGEISNRARDVNLINFLVRDIINLFCNHLELFRACQSKIKELAKLTEDERDRELRLVLAAENSLHPALFSVDAEHKVVQHLMDGLLSIVVKPADLHCSFFRYTARELLACAVVRPVLNLANPRTINEKIENFVLSFGKKTEKIVVPSVGGVSSLVPFFQDHTSSGVELVQLTREDLSEVPGFGNEVKASDKDHHHTKDNWGHALDAMSVRKTQVLAPENLENMWAKGRYYKQKEIANGLGQQTKHTVTNFSSTKNTDLPARNVNVKTNILKQDVACSVDAFPSGTKCGIPTGNVLSHPMMTSYQEKVPHHVEHGGFDSESSYATEDDENTHVTGLGSPGTKVWDSKNKTKVARSHIRHPLESSEKGLRKKSGKGRAFYPRASRSSSGRKRFWPMDHKEPVMEEDARSSYLSGEWSSDSDLEALGRMSSSASVSSSMLSTSASEAHSLSMLSSESLAFDYSFLQLRCEVLGANTVKSGSGTFAVYSIAVVDADKNSWSIKRRFRHFEDLHRRLKEFQEYNLSLPPKHFLSSGSELPVIQERCKLLDRYLKNLLQLPTVSRSIEVWDFLSVDSQTYIFADSLSILQTLSVALNQKPYGNAEKNQNKIEANNSTHLKRERFSYEETNAGSLANSTSKPDGSGLKKIISDERIPTSYEKDGNFHRDSLNSDSKSGSSTLGQSPVKGMLGVAEGQMSQSLLTEVATNPIPSEWVQPNLSLPIFDLVDVIFQLQDGGWIRRQAFWVAKQVLQLGMGDAFDDWLLEKIQLLRKGSVIASAINRVEQILWPDGIFLTKHPSRRRPTPQPSPKEGAKKVTGMDNQLSYEQLEASRRAKFVREMIIDKAPPALVSVIGRKEYERSAQDIYFFLQSSVCLKQLAFELLELLLLATFPELEDDIRSCHQEKERFGSFQK